MSEVGQSFHGTLQAVQGKGTPTPFVLTLKALCVIETLVDAHPQLAITCLRLNGTSAAERAPPLAVSWKRSTGWQVFSLHAFVAPFHTKLATE